MTGAVLATSLSVGGWQFVTILLLIFGLFLVLAGAFTTYFGSGHARTIGVSLVVGGVVLGILFAFLYAAVGSGVSTGGQLNALGTLLWTGFLVIIAAVIGALAAVGVFLVAIMKS